MNFRHTVTITLFVHLLQNTSSDSSSDFYDYKYRFPPYYWSDEGNIYNSIAAIEYRTRLLSTGVFIKDNYVLTAASPYEHLVRWEPYDLERYWEGEWVELDEGLVIFGRDRDNVTHPHVFYSTRVIRNQMQRRGTSTRRRIGFDGLHSSVHDIVIIELDRGITGYNGGNSDNTAHYLKDATKTEETAKKVKKPYEEKGWHYAGFGFKNKYEITEWIKRLRVFNIQSKLTRVDCDEYLVRTWGYFICLRNTEDAFGIGSGAPLFFGKDLVGLGAFELSKEEGESILVFTNLLEYKESHFTF